MIPDQDISVVTEDVQPANEVSQWTDLDVFMGSAAASSDRHHKQTLKLELHWINKAEGL